MKSLLLLSTVIIAAAGLSVYLLGQGLAKIEHYGDAAHAASVAASDALVPETQAMRTALSATGRGRITHVELDEDHGLCWKVEIADGRQDYEVRVDARTGGVLWSAPHIARKARVFPDQG